MDCEVAKKERTSGNGATVSGYIRRNGVRPTLILFITVTFVLLFQRSNGQYDDIAYMPREASSGTADDTSIGFADTTVPGVVELELPPATTGIDLLNAQGTVVRELADSPRRTLDLRELRPGTWTLRAHTPTGIRVRRFLVLSRGGMRWVRQAAMPVRRH